MIRSMFTAISSLRLHQSFMDVVSNNLANANTTAYKASRFSFQDQFSQMVNVGAAPTNNMGGQSPMQIGLGVRLGTITPTFTQGPLQSTGRQTDVAIQGDGFFVYAGEGGMFYSRDGMLEMDSNGFLVHAASGMKIQGWQAANGRVNPGAATTGIQLPLGATLARATQNASLGGNLRSDTALNTPFTATMGVYDSLGTLHSVVMSFSRTANNTWTWTASAPTGSSDTITGTGTINFDANGQLIPPAAGSPAPAVRITATNGSAPTNVTLNFDGLSQLSTEGSVSLLQQDGLAAGSLSSFYVSSGSGEVYGVFSNGMQQLVGQLAMARFTNPTGLIRTGENMFQVGLNSGDPITGAPNTDGRGAIASGHLEGSNVDMAQEFTNMILAQRGFQASSRVITTSDEMLQELVNLKR